MDVTQCELCKGSMIETPDAGMLPTWADYLQSEESPYSVVGWKLRKDADTDMMICPFCFHGVTEATKQNMRMGKANAPAEERIRYSPPDFGLDFGVIDALTQMEEMLLCPVHACVTVYCVWGTGALKYRNMCYGVEQDVPESVCRVRRGRLSVVYVVGTMLVVLRYELCFGVVPCGGSPCAVR